MRLPQSSSQRIFFRVVSPLFLMVASVVIPVCAHASQQLSSSPNRLVFGSISMGQNQTEEIVLTNNGQTSVTISSVSVSGSEFSTSGLSLPATLGPGGSATMAISFSPVSSGWVYRDIVFTSNASNSSLSIPVAGAGGKFIRLQATPSSISFGNVAVGATKSIPVVLKNNLSSDVTLTATRDFGQGFSVTGLTLPMTLSPGQSTTANVAFTPQIVGITEGSVLIEGASLSIPLSGSGTTIGQLAVSPSGLSFGSIDVGSTSTQSATLTATGGTVTISSASTSNSQFSISGASFPLILNAGTRAELTILYSPSKSGSASGTLTLTGNASNTQATESLSGTGVVPQYSVSLSWAPSTSSMAGYNVYRGTAVGAYSKINSTLALTGSYTDSTVVSGTTYYYAATAVNSSGQESGYSSPVQVPIP